MKVPYPTLEAFSAMIRAGDPRAVRYFLYLLKKEGGNVRKVGEQLGVSLGTIYNWRSACPALLKGMEKHGLGRDGAAQAARAARAKQRKDSAE